MNWTCKLLAVALAGAALFSLDFHSRSSAATELNLGVDAVKQSKYTEAIRHLEKAVSLDPENQDARVYLATALATAYAKEYRPGVTTPENIHLAEQAIEQYQHVLDSNPNRTARIDSAKGIASLYLQMNKFDDSKKYYQMASDLDPIDPMPYSKVLRTNKYAVCGQTIPTEIAAFLA
jgi:tetratricopeptide (TPR) repeat protein